MAAMVCNTRALVTIVLYRKWRVKARSRSTDTAAKREKETPAVVQVDKALSLFNVQNEAKLSLSSAIFSATKSGWHISPTRRSEVARQPNRIKDGLWRSCVFPIVNAIRKFPVHVTRENKQLRIHVRMFPTKFFPFRQSYCSCLESTNRFCLFCSCWRKRLYSVRTGWSWLKLSSDRD